VAATVRAHATAGVGKGVSGQIIRTRTVKLNGQSVTVLTDANGRTLYYRTSDTATTVCSGSCATIWKPVTIIAGTPHIIGSLPGKLSVVKNVNGNQVTYNGHPLYIYTSDSAPGDTTGEKVGGVWFVVPTNLK
jgi:predicted lipoprotein with Yx(FWY)xxD motif